MSVAQLFNTPSAPAELLEWSFANMADHIEIGQAILQQKGITVQRYPLDPITSANLDSFLFGHQAMHYQEAEILGVDIQDFGSFDPSNLEAFADWIYEHGDQHRRERAALGI